MKTLMLFVDGCECNFYDLNGDYSHLQKVYLNMEGTTKAQSDELRKLIKENSPLKFPTKDWTHYIECGWYD